jgi:hypothetical protein
MGLVEFTLDSGEHLQVRLRSDGTPIEQADSVIDEPTGQITLCTCAAAPETRTIPTSQIVGVSTALRPAQGPSRIWRQA